MISIDKSSRHTRIVHHFGENLVCNWLSRSGFEVSIVDHTGIGVIAYNPRTGQRLGITVKSRIRSEGTETKSVCLLRGVKSDRKKLLDACTALGCDPWVAVYVECKDRADLFLTSLANYDKRYKVRGKAIDGWAMTEKYATEYASDREVKHIRVEFKDENWWIDRARSAAASL